MKVLTVIVLMCLERLQNIFCGEGGKRRGQRIKSCGMNTIAGYNLSTCHHQFCPAR
jgi:hypothetical protein